MREILFKAKGQTDEKWHIGFLANMYGGICIIRENEHEWICQSDTICQYTGLTDKNGNKIWENDVVKKHFYTDYDAFANSEEYIGKVEYLDCAWSITFVNENNNKCVYPMFMAIEFKDAKHYEVIGNIFDTPELVKEGAE